ncbi:MAG: hypothetical protein GY774_26875 [Planctomycetes bacterium]|nr:hypothetical protein [Planctomycetota bacterium]
MKHKINNTVRILATGFIVMVFLSLILFLVRSSFESDLSIRKPDDLLISRVPCGLVPVEFENDPNVSIHSGVNVQAIINDPLSLGIIGNLEERVPGGRRSNLYFYESDDDYMYFDKKSGLIVHHYEDLQLMPDKRSLPKLVRVYVGPEGISETKDKALGRFIEPIIDRGWSYRVRRNLHALIVYDKKLRRFFKIELNKETVTKGPEFVKNDILHYSPIQIGRLNKSRWLNLIWGPPKVKESLESSGLPGYTSGRSPKPIIPTEQARQVGPYLLVLDKSGRIDLLDRESLEFVENFWSGAGRLFDPESYIRSSRNSTRPGYLLDYDVLPLFLTTHFFGEGQESKKDFFGQPSESVDLAPSRIERKYLGMFVASLSRDGSGLGLTVYDDKGREVIKRESVVQKEGLRTISHRSSKVVYFRPSWTSAFAVGKYLAETIHPPVLSLGSFYTAYSIDAATGHKGLFLLPNSFIAMQGRIDYRNFMLKLLFALWLMLPSIIFSIWLAVRVSKNAVVVGLSDNARLYWILGTLAFGFTAYITYRLTRPKITLVTCQNCGKMRRPDMDRCHRCKSDWFVPELTPPAWRVLDGTEKAEQAEQTEQQTEQIERADEGSISDAEGAEEAGTE